MELNKIHNMDCLEFMKTLPDKCIDLVLTDPPYGTTACKWDTIIPFEPMWEQLKRITKKNGAIVLFGSQPFTSALVMSNPKMFKYEWVWEKDKPSNFALAKSQVMKYHENILVFAFGKVNYIPQMSIGKPNHSVGKGIRKKGNESGANTIIVTNKTDGLKHPKSVLKFNREAKPTHPTQKPVMLMEYLIKTYTNEGEIILDFTVGSGTTCVAAQNLNRNYIGCEISPEYCKIAEERLNKSTNLLF